MGNCFAFTRFCLWARGPVGTYIFCGRGCLLLLMMMMPQNCSICFHHPPPTSQVPNQDQMHQSRRRPALAAAAVVLVRAVGWVWTKQGRGDLIFDFDDAGLVAAPRRSQAPTPTSTATVMRSERWPASTTWGCRGWCDGRGAFGFCVFLASSLPPPSLQRWTALCCASHPAPGISA